MIRALYTSTTGMLAQELQLNITSNNLANVNTTGFKKSNTQFEDLFYQTVRAAGAETAGGGMVPASIQVGMGVRPSSVQRIWTQGDFVETGRELDMAIEGNGFFLIIRDGEEFYIRAGNFTLDSDGFIVDSNGDRLQPEFSVPQETTNITIDSGGIITALDAAGDILASQQLTIWGFVNPGGLNAVGDNQFVETEASGSPFEADPRTDSLGSLAQYFLETSNVDVTTELVNLIITQRAFESNSKGVTTADALLEIANSLVR